MTFSVTWMKTSMTNTIVSRPKKQPLLTRERQASMIVSSLSG